MLYDIIVIGSGPAGISASLYAKRANMNVLIISIKGSTLLKASEIENYYGFAEVIEGSKLYETGLKQALNLGIEIKEEQVVNISFNDQYLVETNKNKYNSKVVIIATGINSNNAKIKGISSFDGRGISYCATCDGFFYKGKNVGVLGNGEYALHEANYLRNISNNITIFTNGINPEFRNNEFNIVNHKIKEFNGNDKLEEVILENGDKILLDGLFIALGKAGGFDFAKKIGAEIEKDKIVVNSNMETNVPGLYACGDVTGGLLQISKAVYEGSKAATEAIKYIRKNK